MSIIRVDSSAWNSTCTPTEDGSDTAIYNRSKDVDSSLGKYLAEKLKAEPWYKDVVPNVWSEIVRRQGLTDRYFSLDHSQKSVSDSNTATDMLSLRSASIPPSTCLGWLRNVYRRVSCSSVPT